MYHQLGICIAEQCNAACEICCFSCSPRRRRVLSAELLADVIRQAGTLEHFVGIGFTGGEPFLFPDLLLDASRLAGGAGFPVSVNTNGFWGKDAGKARAMLADFREAGLVSLSFSADPWHQRFVPQADLLSAVRTALDLGLRVEISVLETRGSDHAAGLAAALGADADRVRMRKVPLLPAGRAASAVPEENFLRLFDPKEAPCCFSGMLHLGFDGCYYFCCSPFSRETSGLLLGDARTLPLKDVERRVAADDFLYVLLRDGLPWFWHLAGELGIPLPDNLCSPCHLCSYLFRDEALRCRMEPWVKREAGALRVQHLLGR